MTKSELSQLYDLNKEIERDKQRVYELECAACAVSTVITGMPHGSGVGDKVGKYASEIADLKAVIELNMQKCWYELNKLNRYITEIPDSMTRQVFQLRYISGLKWYQIAQSIGGITEDSAKQAAHRYIKNSQKDVTNVTK